MEFLTESDVITQELREQIESKIPKRFKQGEDPVKPFSLKEGNLLPSYSDSIESASNDISKNMGQLQITSKSEPSSGPAATSNEYYKALYNYNSQGPDDLELHAGDNICVTDKSNKNWWKGQINGSGRTGTFPSNYVRKIQSSMSLNKDNEKQLSNHQSTAQNFYQAPPPQNRPTSPTMRQMPMTQPNYYNYSQQPAYNAPPGPPQQQPMPYSYPPPPANYYQPPMPIQQPAPQVIVQEQPQQQQPSQMKQWGSRFGEAAVFGAGATLGADVINSIF